MRSTQLLDAARFARLAPPSVRGMGDRALMDQVWPRTAGWTDGELHVAGLGVRELAAQFGTPLYVLDEEDFRARCTAWREALPPLPERRHGHPLQ